MRLVAALALLAAACGTGSTTLSAPRPIAGVYDGQLLTGTVKWTLTGTGTQVSGSGTSTDNTNGQTAAYGIRGTWVLPALTVRLVGAPGDTDADSVWFAGTADLGGYVGTLIHGDLNGHSPTMYGQLQPRARGTP